MPGNVPVLSDDFPAHSAVFSRVYSLYIYLLYIFVAIKIFFLLLKKSNSLVAPNRKPLAIPSPLGSGPTFL